MAERLGDMQRRLACLGDLHRDSIAARDRRPSENPFAVLVFWRIPEDVAAVVPACDDDGEFARELDRGLGDRRFFGNGRPGALLVAARVNPRLALAVVAVATGLQHQRQADLENRRGYVGETAYLP